MMQIPFLFALAVQPDSCREVAREQIYVSDLAPAIPAFSSLPQDLVIGHSPLPGNRRVFSAAELERIAQSHGLSAASLPDVCFTWKASVLQPDDMIAAMRTALGNLDAKVQILAFSQAPVPTGELIFPRNGLQLPPPSGPRGEVLWRGYVLYGENHRFGVWAKARIVADETRVVAIANIPAGQPIQTEQVRLESCEDFPLDSLAARNLDDVIGYVPRQTLREGSAILKTQIDRAPDVALGELVKVEVRSGAAHLTLDGRAQTAGAKGTMILVKNLSTGRNFRAQVVEKGRVAVIAGAVR